MENKTTETKKDAPKDTIFLRKTKSGKGVYAFVNDVCLTTSTKGIHDLMSGEKEFCCLSKMKDEAKK